MTTVLRLATATALLACLLPGFAVAKTAAKPATKSAAKPVAGAYLGAIVIDADSGKVLFEDNADIVNPPASMTKLMTFAVIADKLKSGAITLQTDVEVDAADAKIGGTQVWLKEKEHFTVEDLIYAMMIESANDAAHALARASAGSVEGFVALMNEKAREIGMTHSTFRSPHGLPPPNRHPEDGDLSTPRDYALLCRYLVLETDVTKYTSVRERKFGEKQRTPDRVIDMVNHDHLIGKVNGVDGLKTGFTNAAGFCLSATAQRNGRRVIAVIMHSESMKARDLKMIELLEQGFAALPPATTVKTGAPAPAKSAATPSTPAPAPAKDEDNNIPVVKTDKTPAPAAQQNSTDAAAPLTFQVIPPPKKP